LHVLLLIVLGGVLALAALPSNYVDRMSIVFDALTGNQRAILTESSLRGRAGAVSAAVDMFADHMVLGVGRENYPLYQLEYLEGSALALHNRAIPPHDLYLEIATEHGVVGLVVFAGLLLAAAKALREARGRLMALLDRQGAELAAWLGIGLFGYLVSSVFLHGAFLYMLWLQLALIVALRQISRDAEVVQQPQAVPVDELEPVLPFADPAAPRTYLLPVSLSSPGILSRLLPPLPAKTAAEPETSSVEGVPPKANDTANPAEQFRVFYEAKGGEAIFGKPLGTLMEEQDSDGRPVPVQYYQHARLEYRSEDGAPQDVVIGKLGLEVAKRGKPVDILPPALSGEQLDLGAGGPGVPRLFYQEWQRAGADLFGYPVSPVLLDTSPTGLPICVQYFERARLEYHPYHAGTGYEVQRTPLGLELFRSRYGGTA
ncbi:MAG TPA: O-antigen ligase family protein, partial [Chloroflexia bacterium]